MFAWDEYHERGSVEGHNGSQRICSLMEMFTQSASKTLLTVGKGTTVGPSQLSQNTTKSSAEYSLAGSLPTISGPSSPISLDLWQQGHNVGWILYVVGHRAAQTWGPRAMSAMPVQGMG